MNQFPMNRAFRAVIIFLVAAGSVAGIGLGVWLHYFHNSPRYPQAGLFIRDPQGGHATMGFYQRHELGDGLQATLRSNGGTYTTGGHRLAVRSEVGYGLRWDTYTFDLEINGKHIRRTVKYAGMPVRLLDGPLIVDLMDL